MLTPDNEFEAIQLVLKGDSAAFARLVEQYRQYVFTLSLKFVPDRETAEELTQDVFLKVYRCLADFKGTSKFSTWLYSVTHNTCISHLRKKNLQAVYPGADGLALLSDLSGSTAADAALDRKARQQAVEKAIAALAPDDAEIVTLFYLADQSLEEIATITGLAPGNVKVKLFRARQKLKGLLEGKV